MNSRSMTEAERAELAALNGAVDAAVAARRDWLDAKMVELPLSADGYVWTGREECFWTGSADEDWHKFDGIHYADGRWCVEDNDCERYPAASVWYTRPDSLERIADELDEMVDTADLADDNCEKLANIADRIRNLAKKEASNE